MAILELEAFTAALQNQKGRILGLDMGTKTIGLALSDRTFSVASPHLTIARKSWEKDKAALFKEIEDNKVIALVIGLPIQLDGEEGERCHMVRVFADKLIKETDLPICFWDERLSTAAVTKTMLEADLSRKRRAELVDKLAASYILQGFLDRIS